MKDGVERAKLVQGLWQESRQLRLLVLVIGFFLVTLTFIIVSKPDALLFNRTPPQRQRVDATVGSQRSAGGEDPAPKVVDDGEDGDDVNAKGTSEEGKRVLTSEPEQGKKEEEATASELLVSISVIAGFKKIKALVHNNPMKTTGCK